MSGASYVAIDLGAESGRVVVGTLEQGRVRLAEMHRFANVPVRTPDGLHWDILRLYAEILDGLRLAAQRYDAALAGIGVDSWGVDYGLIDAAGRLLGNPYSYRDARTDGMSEQAARTVSSREQYARTGIAQLPFNTIYQLMALGRSDDHSVDLAVALLMIPDLLHYWLCGERAAEYTNATTTGALGVDGTWARDLLDRLDAPSHMLLPPSPAGTRLGLVRQAVRDACNLAAVPVYLPATHDTGCAVVAVPADQQMGTHAYISCGTWSLLGLELDQPILSDEARRAGFTNEGGVAGTYRFLTNISGLWLVQECRRAWARHGVSWEYEDLANQAATVPTPNVVFDVDDALFLHPEDMPEAINTVLARTGQQPITYAPELIRAVLENLALKYRVQLERASS
ncbi:MAG TPA: rhamnulokinase family protein [Chloroflexota bacterium]|nr:rhamnulokinase family protein [Chloroflexota bacterium]